MAYPANTARAVFQFTLANGTAGYVTPHFRKNDGGDFTQLEVAGLAVLLEDWATSDNFEGETNQSLMSVVVDEVSLASITVTSLAAVTPVQAVLASGESGNITSTPLPNETSFVTTYYTGIVGRSYRGRGFWPGLPITAMDNSGTMSAGFVDQLQTTFRALLDGLASVASSQLAVNSETLGLSTPVTSILVRDTLHHQRRRNS